MNNNNNDDVNNKYATLSTDGIELVWRKSEQKETENPTVQFYSNK